MQGNALEGTLGLSLPSYSPIPVEGGMSNPTGQFRLNCPLPSRLWHHTLSSSFLPCYSETSRSGPLSEDKPTTRPLCPFSTPLLISMLDAGRPAVLFHKVRNLESTSHATFLIVCSRLQILKFKYII